MKRLISILPLLFMLSTTFSQTRNNIIYASPLPSDLAIGLDHAFQLSHKKWSSGRFYFVISPNLYLTRYNHDPVDGEPQQSSKFSQYEFSLPLHIRYELAPFRLLKGTKPGKHDNDFSVFFDVGISLNYILSANLTEQYNYSGTTNYQYTFDGSITNTVDNRLTTNYLTFNMGVRFQRFTFFLRHYEPFNDTKYQNPTSSWGKPQGISSFFYDHYTVDSYYQQGINILCLGYTF